MNSDDLSLCICGGGMKGGYIIGAMKYLEDKGKMNKFTSYVGTSIGGILLMLYIIGYNVYEIEEFFYTFNFSDVKIDLNIDKLISAYGCDDMRKILYVYEELFKYKNLSIKMTFEEIHNKTQKHLKMTTANLNECKLEIMDYINTPELTLETAIRRSTALPLIFEPYKSNNNIYYVDGGLMDLFPYEHCNKNMIGIIFDYKPPKIDGICSYIYAILYTGVYNKLNDIMKSEEIMRKCIIIPDEISNISQINFEITNNDKINMVKHGYECANRYYMLDNE